MAHWLDQALIPYARPGYLVRDRRLKSTEPRSEVEAYHPIAAGYVISFAAAMLRWTGIMAAVLSGVAAGI